jgi:hypothetical protein
VEPEYTVGDLTWADARSARYATSFLHAAAHLGRIHSVGLPKRLGETAATGMACVAGNMSDPQAASFQLGHCLPQSELPKDLHRRFADRAGESGHERGPAKAPYVRKALERVVASRAHGHSGKGPRNQRIAQYGEALDPRVSSTRGTCAGARR